MIEVLLINETESEVPASRIRKVVSAIVQDAGYQDAEISLAVIDDPSMHKLNRDHLQHDYPTDVLSFVFASEDVLEGEVIVSIDTAIRVAEEYQWPTESELLLYFIHGTLHLIGHDDHETDQRVAMREKETHYLQSLGIQATEKHRSWASSATGAGQDLGASSE